MMQAHLDGLFDINISQEYEGKNLPLSQIVDIFIDISFQNLGAAAILGSHVRVAYSVGAFGTDEQKQMYLPRMVNGQIIAAHAHTERQPTVAVKTGPDYILNGNKPIVTNGRCANLVMVTANNHQDSFLINLPQSGLCVGKEIPRLALKDISLCSMTFTDCAVSGGALLGGFEKKGVEYLRASHRYGMINYAARSIGASKSILDELLKMVRAGHVPNDQVTRITLATLGGRVRAAEALTREAARTLEQNCSDESVAYHAKLIGAELCRDVALAAYEIQGYKEETLALEQKLIDTLTLTIVGGRLVKIKDTIGSRFVSG